MNKLGLVSVTFRSLLPKEIIDICLKNGLEEIEWGGDIHVPHGDIKCAEKVYNLCAASGIRVSSYGSYYRVGIEKGANPEWPDVLNTAVALHAPVIRIWVCNRGGSNMDDALFMRAVSECREICDLAAEKNIIVCPECHPNTLTEDYRDTVKFFNAVDRPNLKLYWQPNQHKDLSYNIEAIRALRENVINVHTFYWTENEKLPLRTGKELWKKYTDEFNGFNVDYLFEFMPGGSPKELGEEVKTFKEIISE